MFSRFLSKRPILSFREYKTLRKLNRENRFGEVVKEYEESGYTDVKSKQQYLFALKHLQLQTPPVEEKTTVGLTDSNPVYFKKVETTGIQRYLPYLPDIVASVFLLGGLWIISKQARGGGGMPNLSSQTKSVNTTNYTFDDVRGIDECKAELEETVHFLKNPANYVKSGAKLPKGILLTGEPGTGKTLLAKAIAGEANVKFFYSSGSEFEEVFVGLGAKRVRDLFETAKQNSPCVIFIDEIDAIGGSRTRRDASFNRQSLNQLLVELDGFEPHQNIIVIAATNFPQSLDKALTRAGRFDKEIAIPLPDIKGRTEILDLYLGKVKHDSSIDKNLVSRMTFGMTGSDLANLVNTAVLKCIKDDREEVTLADIEYAKDRMVIGITRSSMIMTEEDKFKVAIHETGHALTGILTDGCAPIYKTTILPSGGALGVTKSVPDKDIHTYTRKDMLAMIDLAMGGRAAEELFFNKNDLTLGCTSDLSTASTKAYYVVRTGIFDEYGIHASPGLTGDNEGVEQRDKVDNAVREILSMSYKRVKQLLDDNKALVLHVAQELKARETLTGVEIRQLIDQFRS